MPARTCLRSTDLSILPPSTCFPCFVLLRCYCRAWRPLHGTSLLCPSRPARDGRLASWSRRWRRSKLPCRLPHPRCDWLTATTLQQGIRRTMACYELSSPVQGPTLAPWWQPAARYRVEQPGCTCASPEFAVKFPSRISCDASPICAQFFLCSTHLFHPRRFSLILSGIYLRM